MVQLHGPEFRVLAGRSDQKTARNQPLQRLGLFQFTVMPFCLANSPSTFERLMEDVLRGLQWVELLLYMDNIISPSRSVDEGLNGLQNILTGY